MYTHEYKRYKRKAEQRQIIKQKIYGLLSILVGIFIIYFCNISAVKEDCGVGLLVIIIGIALVIFNKPINFK